MKDRKSKTKRKGCVLKILLIKDHYYDTIFKQEQYFITDNRNTFPIEKTIFAEDICHRNVHEIVVWGSTYWPGSSRLVARLLRFRLTPYGTDRTSRWHLQTKLRVTKIFAYYSAVLGTRKRILPHISERLFIFRARKRSAPRHFFPNIYHLQLHEGNDQVKKRGREVNGSFVMFQLVFRKFLRRSDGHVERENSNGMDD